MKNILVIWACQFHALSCLFLLFALIYFKTNTHVVYAHFGAIKRTLNRPTSRRVHGLKISPQYYYNITTPNWTELKKTSSPQTLSSFKSTTRFQWKVMRWLFFTPYQFILCIADQVEMPIIPSVAYHCQNYFDSWFRLIDSNSCTESGNSWWVE